MDENKSSLEFSSLVLASMSKSTGISKTLYDFMKANGIGESLFGQAMDKAGSQVMNHRLYGHHFMSDFPSRIKDVPDFILHEVSDILTKQGLPILPGELVGDTKFYSHCSQIQSPNWNMVNGFDILAGAISIYYGFRILSRAINGSIIINDFNDFVNTIGLGLIEITISISTANPLLLIGGLLNLLAGIIALTNENNLSYLEKYTNQFSISFCEIKWTLEDQSSLWMLATDRFSLDQISRLWEVDNQNWE